MKNLPNKPSALIRLSLKDLRAVEAMPKDRYEVNMDVWVNRRPNGGKCSVCFAGSVMIGSLGASVLPETYGLDSDARLFPSNFNDRTADKLRGLDAARVGRWDEFLNYVYGWDKVMPPEKLRGFTPASYGYDPAKFKLDMEKAAKILERAGM